METKIELKPTNQKSFYGKAHVIFQPDKSRQVLVSYGTPIMAKYENGNMFRIDTEWARNEEYSATTGKHIKEFCGLNKKEFLKLEFDPVG